MEIILTLPDLILIDGGKGQYSSAKEVLDEFGLHDLTMIAIAKGKEEIVVMKHSFIMESH